MRWRAAIGAIHLYLGLASFAVVTLVGVTGSLIVFEEELDRLIDPDFFAVDAGSRSGTEPMPVDAAIRLVEAERPGLAVRGVDFRHMPDGPYVLRADRTDAQGHVAAARQVSVDPYAGRVIGERGALNPVALMWRLHADLLMGRVGQIILGVSAIILCISAVSGLVLWWPRRGKLRQALTIKRPASPHRRHVDIHRVTGIYLFVPLFVAAFTGVGIIWPQYTFPALELVLEIPETERPSRRPIDPRMDIGADAAIHLARQHITTGAVRTLHLPSPTRPVYVVAIRSFANGHPRGRSYVYLYPDTGETWFWEETRGNTLGYQIRWEWLLPTHSGDILGLPGKIAMLLAGLAPALFTVTGLVIWRNKRRARLARAARPTATVCLPAAERG